MSRKQIWLSPDKANGDWKIHSPKGERAIKRSEEKQDLLARAIEIAKNSNAELIIQKADGRIQDKRTYGEDPYPPKG